MRFPDEGSNLRLIARPGTYFQGENEAIGTKRESGGTRIVLSRSVISKR
jgi:hypothetical protein